MGSANAFKKLADHLNDSRSNSVIIQDILLTIKSDTTSVQDKLEQLNKFALVLKVATRCFFFPSFFWFLTTNVFEHRRFLRLTNTSRARQLCECCAHC